MGIVLNPVKKAFSFVAGSRLWAVSAFLALIVTAGLWWWSTQTKTYTLRLAAGVELRYRKELVQILCEEADDRDLAIEIMPSINRSANMIARVAAGDVDAAMVPAGMAVEDDNIRQVAVFGCEPLQLFVRPEIAESGIAGLRGCRINLGPEESGTRVIANEVFRFVGMKAGTDFQDTGYNFKELIALPTDKMPDAVFSLSPLPSPLGEHMAKRRGYRMLELPFGAAMALRKSVIEDTVIPAHTYSADPAVPKQELHTVGTRALLVANANVSKIAIRRLLEVIYESDFARRLGITPMSETSILSCAEYLNHPGTIAYLHRHDPWINKGFIDNIMSLRGFLVSMISSGLLLWQWYRRSGSTNLDDYFRACTALELASIEAAGKGFEPSQREEFQKRLTDLRLQVLQQHQAGVLAADQQFVLLLSRLEGVEQAIKRVATLVNDAREDESEIQKLLSLPLPLRQAS